MTYADVPLRRPRRLFHPGLVAIGSTLLISAFITDGVYWQTMLFQWNNFSGWLITAGLIIALLAAIAFVIDLASRRMVAVAWLRFFGLAIAVLLSVLNAFVHSRDGYAAVIPEGIVLSTVVTILLVAVGVGGWNLERDAYARIPSSRGVRS